MSDTSSHSNERYLNTPEKKVKQNHKLISIDPLLNHIKLTPKEVLLLKAASGLRVSVSPTPLVNNVKITYDLERERAGVPVRFFHVK